MMKALADLRNGDRWLVALTVVCAVTVTAELLWPHPLEIDAAPAEATALDAPPLSGRERGAAGDYQLIADRPLFTTDRRAFQPPPAPVAVQQPVGPRAQFELSAIVTSADARVALLKSNLSPAVKKVGLNQVVEGWTVEEVRTDAVVLRQGAEVQLVELKAAGRAARGTTGEASFVRQR